jgi:branched-chain amino acid transport system permease protein
MATAELVDTGRDAAVLRHRSYLPWLLGGVVVAGAIGLQPLLYPGQQRSIASVFMFVALAQSWNVIGGYTGYASFGQVAFFGIGGYVTAALMVHVGLSFWACLLLAGVFAAVVAVLIGLPLLRLRGHYFAIATLGVAEGAREIVTNIPRITGGGAGITIPTFGAEATTRYLGNDGFYVVFLLLAAFAVAVVAIVARGKFGLALRAIHQDEDAAASSGINTTWTKVAAFAISGFLAGTVGAAYAFQQVTIYPDRLFDGGITVLMIVMVVLGGSGTVLGPVIGAVGLQFVSEYLRHHYTDYHTFILGGIIILAVVLLPQGVVAYARDGAQTRNFSLLANVRRYRL